MNKSKKFIIILIVIIVIIVAAVLMISLKFEFITKTGSSLLTYTTPLDLAKQSNVVFKFQYPTGFTVFEGGYKTPGGGRFPDITITKVGGTKIDMIRIPGGVSTGPTPTCINFVTANDRCIEIKGYVIMTNSKDKLVIKTFDVIKSTLDVVNYNLFTDKNGYNVFSSKESSFADFSNGEKSRILKFYAYGDDFVVEGLLSRVEIWMIPTGTGITKQQWKIIGSAEKFNDDFKKILPKWVLPIKECPSATHIFARGYDLNGNKLPEDVYLPYIGVSEIYDNICKNLGNKNKDWQTLNDINLKYSIKYPRGKTYQGEVNGESAIYIENDSNRLMFKIGIVRLTLELYEDSIKDIKITKESEIIVDKIKSKKINYIGKLAEGQYVVVPKDNFYYQFNAYTNNKEYLTIFEQMILSIKFND